MCHYSHLRVASWPLGTTHLRGCYAITASASLPSCWVPTHGRHLMLLAESWLHPLRYRTKMCRYGKLADTRCLDDV